MMKSIIIFLPEFRENTPFVDQIVEVVSGTDREVEVVYVKKNVNPLQQQQFLVASLVADVVVADFTVPGTSDDGGVYPALTAHVNSLNHIIAVSETPLPLNITPNRNRCVAPTDNDNISTSKILEELPGLVNKSLSEDVYDRLPAEELLEDILKFQKEQEEMIAKSLDFRNNRKSGKTPVMISYRNSHNEKVEAFKKLILDDSEEGKLKKKEIGLDGIYDIKILPPASLCGEYEAHTPMRRWMLVGILEDHIREVDEVWVYESRDDSGEIDYTNSWWTIAEMIMVANLNHNNVKQIKVRAFNPVENRFYDTTPEKYLVELSEEQHRRLARYLSNTRPDTMGPECLDQVKQMTLIADFLRSELVPQVVKDQMLDSMRANFEQTVPKSLSENERKAMVEDMMSLYSNPDEIDRYVSDDVFQESFWNYISYQTTPTTPCFENDRIDVDRFMSIPMEELTGYTIDAFKAASESETRTLVVKDVPLEVTKAPYNRMLWLATRMGQPTVKEGNPPGLEVIPIYNVRRK